MPAPRSGTVRRAGSSFEEKDFPMLKRFAGLLSFVFFCAACALPAVRARSQTPQYTIVELSAPPGTSGFTASALNNRGYVVGYATYTATSETHLFLYSNGVMRDLNVILDRGEPLFINDNGQIAGTASNYTAFLYDNGVATQINTSESFANGLNNRGDVIGWFASNRPNSPNAVQHPFIFSNGVFHDIGTFIPAQSPLLAYGQDRGVSNAINDVEQVVGLTATPTLVNYGYGPTILQDCFLYTNGILSTLGTPNSQSRVVTPNFINNLGQIAGTTNSSFPIGFFYQNGVFDVLDYNRLNSLKPGYGYSGSQILALNNRGQAIGYIYSGNYRSGTFFYDNGAINIYGSYNNFSVSSAMNDLGDYFRFFILVFRRLYHTSLQKIARRHSTK